jgi:hypothetical protein
MTWSFAELRWVYVGFGAKEGLGVFTQRLALGEHPQLPPQARVHARLAPNLTYTHSVPLLAVNGFCL